MAAGPSQSSNKGAAPRGPQAPRAAGRGAGGKGGRGGNRGGQGRGGARGQTFNYMQPMSDQQIAKSASDIANAQVTEPYAQLARQIARNNAQSNAAEAATAGMFGQLGQGVQQANQQTGQVSAGLNDQLAKIGQETQGQIGQAFQPSQALTDLANKGLSGGGFDALAAEQARQQGYGAQNAGAFRSFGATQGANAQQLGAANQGAYALRGQETLGGIAKAGQLRNAGLADKQAGLIANRGNLYASAVGKLQQQNSNQYLAAQSLNLKDVLGQNTIATDAARTAQGQARVNQGQARVGQAGARDRRAAAKDAYQRAHGLGPYKAPTNAAGRRQAQAVAKNTQTAFYGSGLTGNKDGGVQRLVSFLKSPPPHNIRDPKTGKQTGQRPPTPQEIDSYLRSRNSGPLVTFAQDIAKYGYVLPVHLPLARPLHITIPRQYQPPAGTSPNGPSVPINPF